MKEQVISFSTAILAREKGFPQSILPHEDPVGHTDIPTYYPDGKIRGFWFNPYDYHKETARAATQALVQKWLREVQNIQVYCYSITKNGEGKYRDYVAYVNGVPINDARDEEYQTYEAALENGLVEALKLI